MPIFELFKQDITLYRAASGSDTRQVPASGTLTVYFKGARASGTSSGTVGVVSPVYDPGTIRVGDTLQKNENASPTGTVTVVTATSITANWGATVNISTGDRLIIVNRQPGVFTDPQGVTSAAPLNTDATTGFVRFYTRPRDIDIVATVSGVSRVLDDLAGGGHGTQLEPLDFGVMADGTTDDSAALAQVLEYAKLRGSGKVVLPPGVMRLGTGLLFPTNTSLTVEGSGRGVTILEAVGGSITPITMAGTDSSLERMTIRRTVNGSPSSFLISSSGSRNLYRNLRLQNGAVGILEIGTDNIGEDIICDGAGWEAFYRAIAATRPHLRSLRGRFANNLGSGAGIIIDPNTVSARLDHIDVAPSELGSFTGRALLIEDLGSTAPYDIVVTAAHLVGGDLVAAPPQPAVEINGGRVVKFIGCTTEDSREGWLISNANTIDVSIMGCSAVGMQQEAVDINGGSQIKITDLTASNCSEELVFNFNVVDIAAGVDDVQIRGLTVGRMIRGTGTPAMGFAVNIASGASDRIQVMGISGDILDLVGWVSNGSTTGNVDISHNLEFGNQATYTHIPVAHLFGYTKFLLATEVTTSVLNVGVVYLQFSGATNFATMTEGGEGQRVVLVARNGNATITATGNFDLNTSGNFVMGTGDTIEFVYDSGAAVWREIARSNN